MVLHKPHPARRQTCREPTLQKEKQKSMRKDLREIKYQLKEIAEKESMKLFRMARNLQKRGGSVETVSKIREEAFKLHNTGYPERLLDDFIKWEFAFK